MDLFSDLNSCLQLTCQLVALAAIMEAAGLLAVARQFGPGGINAWELVTRRERFPRTFRRLPAPVLRFLGFPGPVVMPWLRLFAGMTLVVAPHEVIPRTVALWVLYLTGMGQQIRGHTSSGAESNLRTMIGGLAWAHLVPGSIILGEAALWFIGIHTVVCYAANGWFKLRERGWRQGKVTEAIARDTVFGLTSLEHLARRYPAAWRRGAGSAVTFQCLFPLALVTGEFGCLIFLFWGLAFHLINAFALGLGSFLFSFPAGYPALLFVSLRIQRLISGVGENAPISG